METMTVTQVLKITADNLGMVAVPRALNQQIGIPIDQAISNIMVCLEALEKAEKKDEKPEETEGKDGNADAE